jgi:hypothetical protein
VRKAEEDYQLSLNLSPTERVRLKVKGACDHKATQVCTSVVLLANFVFSIAQTEMNLEESSTVASHFDIIEMCFTAVYLTELLANMFGYWFKAFFRSAWNWFDLIIVGVSVFDALYVLSGGHGSGLNILRLIRIFRIFRIFNKLDSMHRIMHAILAAFGPMLNAFLLFVVVISIYSVIAVNLFRKYSHEHFQSFSLSFYTLLGVATGEDWVVYLHNSLREPGEGVDSVVAVYFVSYIGLVFIVSFNIIVGVLIEAFMSSMSQDDCSKRIIDEAREHHRNAGP